MSRESCVHSSITSVSYTRRASCAEFQSGEEIRWRVQGRNGTPQVAEDERERMRARNGAKESRTPPHLLASLNSPAGPFRIFRRDYFSPGLSAPGRKMHIKSKKKDRVKRQKKNTRRERKKVLVPVNWRPSNPPLSA